MKECSLPVLPFEQVLDEPNRDKGAQQRRIKSKSFVPAPVPTSEAELDVEEEPRSDISPALSQHRARRRAVLNAQTSTNRM